MRKFRVAAVAGVVVVGTLALQAASAPASMYWGATISGETYGHPPSSAPMNKTAWDLFERHAGKEVAILNTGQGWATFDEAEMDATHAGGAIPIVTMGLGAGVTLEEIVNGEHDSAIESWAADAEAWGHPFFFAPWWEMNGEWYPWGRHPNFVEAWRRFHDLVVAEGATNATWTWVTNSLWFDPGSDPAPYYPGDAYVDWVGIDSYNWGRNPAQPDRWINPDQTISPTLERVGEIAPGKPVVIVENASSEIGGNKADWIAEMLGSYLPHHPEIKAYLWFNWNFQKPSGLRADWPIESSTPAQLAFRKGIQSAIYRSVPPVLADLTKVPPPPPPPAADGPGGLDLSAAGQEATAPQVAVAPDGTATVVWSGAPDGADFTVYMRRIAPDGTPGAANPLSAPGQDALTPQVAVAPDGTATVVWIRSDGSNFVVQARRIAPDGALGSTTDLSVTGRDAAGPQLAVAPDGTATVVWKRFDGVHFLVKERQIHPDGTFNEVSSHTLSATGRDAVGPQVAVAPDGTATVVWSRFDGTSSVVQEVRVAPDGTPEAGVDDLSASGQNAIQPGVVVGGDGIATVIWTRFDGSNWIVQERQVSPGGLPDPVTHGLSAPGQNAVEPQIALGPGETATVVWERYDGSNFIVQERRVGLGGVPETSARNISSSGQDAAEPQVAVAPDGAATVVWSRFDGSNFVVQRRSISPAGATEPLTTLSAPGRGASAPQVELGGDGAVTATWKRFDGAHDIVQGVTAALPAAAPTPPTETPVAEAPVALPGIGAGAIGIDNSFQIGRPILNRKSGTARLPVTVPGAGTLILAGAGVATRALDGAGIARFQIRPRGRKRRTLERRGAVTLKVTVTFIPTGGSPNYKTATLRLTKRR